jgi:hypothetical protein
MNGTRPHLETLEEIGKECFWGLTVSSPTSGGVGKRSTRYER